MDSTIYRAQRSEVVPVYIFRNSLWRRLECTHPDCRAIARIGLSALTICRSRSGNGGFLCYVCPSCGKGVSISIDSIEIWRLDRELVGIRIINWWDDPEFAEHIQHPLAFVPFSDDEAIELSFAMLSGGDPFCTLDLYAYDLRDAYPQVRLT